MSKSERTQQKLIANETLYQLSYTPEIFGKSPFNVQNFGCNSTAAHPFCPPDEFRESISVREIAFDQIRRFTKVGALDNARRKVRRRGSGFAGETVSKTIPE